MIKIRSVYIIEHADQGWIIEKLMRDIAIQLQERGISVRIGPSDRYIDEEVIFNSRFLVPYFDDKAKINSLFITHIDDKIKENEVKFLFNRFNSFVCLSPQDAEFISALKGCASNIVGIELPPRDLKVRPIRIAIFSACYDDGRKNEHWIAEYFAGKSSADMQNFVFCFIGWDWEKFCASLGKLGGNYEIYRYSRLLPGEYELSKEVLATMDVLIYPGFDGGAMSIYDGINAGIQVIASNISYHRNLGESVALFDDKTGFFQVLDGLYVKHQQRKTILQERSISNYVDKLLDHWSALLVENSSYKTPLSESISQTPNNQNFDKKVLKLHRNNYKKISLNRIRSAIIRLIQK
jgi:hypothetical protein